MFVTTRAMHFELHRLDEHAATGVHRDYRAMVAGLVAVQSASAAAQAQMHHNVTRSIDSCQEQAIVTLLQARPGWRAAASILQGSFHPGIVPLIVDNVS